jgi:hypothetical protein
MTLKGIKAVSLSLAFLLSSCQQKKVHEVLRDFESKRYSQTLETPHFHIEVRYMPLVYRLLKSSDVDTSISIGELKRAFADGPGKSSKGLVFYLRLVPDDQVSNAEIQLFINSHISTGFESEGAGLFLTSAPLREKIWIESGNQKLSPAEVRIENTYGLSRTIICTVLFSNSWLEKAAKGKFDFVIDDLVPGMARRKIGWMLPIGKYDESI